MALKRALLKSMGLTEEQMDAIIEAHAETVEGLKTQINELQKDAETVSALKDKLEATSNELETLKGNDGGYKEKYEAVSAEYETYKQEIVAKEKKAQRDNLAAAYFKEKGIADANIALAMRSATAEINALEMGEDGKATSYEALDALIAGDLKGLVVNTTTQGVQTTNPPTNDGEGVDLSTLSMEDYIKQRKGGI